MITIVETLIEMLVVLGTSRWGWIGVALGFAASFLVWEALPPFPARGVLAAIAFLVVFMLCAWRELGRRGRTEGGRDGE